MQRCHPEQVPSGIPLAAGDTPWGLQRMGNGLVAVCVEIHDKREGQSVSGSTQEHDHEGSQARRSLEPASTLTRVAGARQRPTTSHRGQGQHVVPAKRNLDGREQPTLWDGPPVGRSWVP